MTVAILDLGYGNVGSITLALRRAGAEPVATADPDALAGADKVILPGVGAAGYAARRLDELGLREPLKRLEQPVLGICLGMQLLFARSEEDGADGLGILPGEVRRLTPAPDRPVPHMGWSRLTVTGDAPGLRDGDYVYFAHSYAADYGRGTVATADHGGPIPAVIRHRNWTGTQFHPERSGEAGARFMAAWLAEGRITP